MPLYRVVIEVHDVRGRCVAGYRPGDGIVLEGFYVVGEESVNINYIVSYDDSAIGVCPWGFSKGSGHRLNR